MEQRGLDFDQEPAPAPRRRVLTVSEISERILSVLETEFLDVWVEGEVSNLRQPGHWYFSLKDDRAQIRAVVWKSAARLVRFQLRDGMKVLVRGGVRGYAPRGEYQIDVKLVEPLGKGSLQQAFEDLKERLGREGLFDAGRKRPLPRLPRRVGVVTSPTGAAIRDIVRVLASRYANLDLLVYPARVQGAEAAAEIVQGIEALNRVPGVDVLVVARGGGSLEDLWPFNEEAVARALAASRIPTVSAVGHETDFTIADFVADLRAPTPSAAAERVVQAKAELRKGLLELQRRQDSALRLRLERLRARVSLLAAHRVFEAERGRLRALATAVTVLGQRRDAALSRRLERARLRVLRAGERVEAFRLDRQLAERQTRLARARELLGAAGRSLVEARRATLGRCAARLESLSPLSVLGRGYALVWNGRGHLVRDPGEVEVGEALRLRVHGGGLGVRVETKERP